MGLSLSLALGSGCLSRSWPLYLLIAGLTLAWAGEGSLVKLSFDFWSSFYFCGTWPLSSFGLRSELDGVALVRQMCTPELCPALTREPELPLSKLTLTSGLAESDSSVGLGWAFGKNNAPTP